jgi:hypothetical protein
VVADLRHELEGVAPAVDQAIADGALEDAANRLDAGKIQVKINGRNVIDIDGSKGAGRLIIRDPATGKTVVEARSGPNGGVLNIDAGEAPVAPATPKPVGSGTP